jgi:ABC-type multidrug transport system fused ATPase/permease subunit
MRILGIVSPWKADIRHAKTPLRFILAVSKPYKYWAIATLILGAIANGIASFTPVIYKLIVDSITQLAANSGSYEALYFWLFAYVGISVAGLILWRAVNFTGSKWSLGVRVTGRYVLTTYILGHSHQYYENRFAGSVASKIHQARDGARNIVESVFTEFWPLLVSLMVGFYLAFSTNMILGAIFFSWLLITIPLNTYLARYRMRYAMTAHRLETDLRGRTVDILGNIRAVREYAREYYETKSLRSLIGEHKQAEVRNWRMGQYIITLNGMLQAVFMLSMLLFSVHLASVGAISLGSIILVLALITSVGQNIFLVGQRIASISEQWSEVKEALSDILNPHEVEDVPYATDLQVTEGGLAFKNVSFAYPDGRVVLKDFSLTIKPGEKIGLVGRSGAGKSTLIKLLLRHYNLTGGSIRIDGQDIALQKQASVRKEISVVPQEPLLLHRTIRENIAYGKPDATEAEIKTAAKLARADGFIKRMSNGYETTVGERGVKLSGGERQRIALARAILKPSKILVLDEATSALDSESEAAIQLALQTLMVGKTVIAVAHRLSTLREMDRILVLDKGVVVEDGTHAELIGQGGIYADLWAHQSGGYEAEESGMYKLSSEGQMQIFDALPISKKEKKEER